jgi:hypothetical protein
MEESKTFRNIWRFNAIIIAIAGVLAIIVLSLAAILLFKENTRNHRTNEIVNLNPKTNIKEIFQLGNIEHVQGYSSVIIPLNSDQDFNLGYSGSKSSVSTRNLLFTNLNLGTSHWLFSNNGYLISSHRLIRNSDSYNEDKPVLCILYYIVKSDTNGDMKLTESDDLTIAISKPDGTNYQEILSDVKDVLGYEVLGQETIAILFARNQKSYIQYVNIADLKTTKQIELPKLN